MINAFQTIKKKKRRTQVSHVRLEIKNIPIQIDSASVLLVRRAYSAL
jgi:hypothetical protein